MPKLRYKTVENVKSGDPERVIQGLRIAFERSGIKNLENSIFGLNVDGASTNNGTKRRLGMLIKQNPPWLELFHCFNHRLELALKDVFDNSLFRKIDMMLIQL